jgi:hypothetical protein
MSTTLHAHPPRTRDDEQLPAPRLTSRRPTLLDRLALRLGLLLITYGRRRYAASREELAHRARHLADQAELQRRWERQRYLLLPPR